MDIIALDDGFTYGLPIGGTAVLIEANASMNIKDYSGTREQWLNRGVKELRKRVFKAHMGEFEWPDIAISVGFPKGARGKSKAIGQCWSKRSSTDGKVHIFVSPVLDDPVRVLDTVAHELVHAVVGNECGHRGAFKDMATAIGLTGKMTATVAGPELEEKLNSVVHEIGKYPHGRLNLRTLEVRRVVRSRRYSVTTVITLLE